MELACIHPFVPHKVGREVISTSISMTYQTGLYENVSSNCIYFPSQPTKFPEISPTLQEYWLFLIP